MEEIHSAYQLSEDGIRKYACLNKCKQKIVGSAIWYFWCIHSQGQLLKDPENCLDSLANSGLVLGNFRSLVFIDIWFIIE